MASSGSLPANNALQSDAGALRRRFPTSDAGDYQPGDLVIWMLPGNLPHIGIVTDKKSLGSDRP